MGKEYEVTYHDAVVRKDIPALSSDSKKRIKQSIERKLAVDPISFGIPLRASLRGYQKLRVGDYRVIFALKGSTVRVLYIGHRSVVYREVVRRLR